MACKVYQGKRFLCNSEILRGVRSNIGLMFQRKLKPKESVILELPKMKVQIHTFFVFFPIDLFFLDKNFRVIEKAAIEPWNAYSQKKKAAFLLEANRGELRLKVGDRLRIR